MIIEQTPMTMTAKSVMDELKNTVYVLEDYPKKKDIKKFAKKMYDYIKEGYEHKEFREHPVNFKFRRSDTKIHNLQFRRFITNLFFWKGIIRLGYGQDLDTEHILDCSKLSTTYIEDYLNNYVVIPYRDEIDLVDLNIALHDILHDLTEITNDFNIILGLSINVESFIEVAKAEPRFNEIIRTKVPDDMQPYDVEQVLNSLMHEAVDILKRTDNVLRPMLMTNSGIKIQQLRELIINGGMKPTLQGNTIPKPINSNLLVGGFGDVGHYYIDSMGGRKAAIMNKMVMGDSGRFSRMVMLSTSGCNLDNTLDDCGTVNSVKLEIRTKRHLDKIVGRYYRTRGVPNYSIVKTTDTHLIGKTIFLKSPTKCAGRKGICRRCYGSLYKVNKDLNSQGMLAATEETNPISQSVLSTKHLLTTNSDKIKFNDVFYDFLALSINEIVLNTEDDSDIEFENYQLVIYKDDLRSVEAYDVDEGEDEDDTDAVDYYTSRIFIRDIKSKVEHEIKEENGNDMYVSAEIVNILNRTRLVNDAYAIPLTSLPYDTSLFGMTINNNELTKPLHMIMRILDRVDHGGCESIDEVVQSVLDLNIESGFRIMSVHAEMIVRPLIRSARNILKSPNFRKYPGQYWSTVDLNKMNKRKKDEFVNENDYTILTIDSCLQNHPSPLVTLSYQNLKARFVDENLYERDGASFISPMFKER